MMEDRWSEERLSSSVRLSIKRSEAREFLELLADEGDSGQELRSRLKDDPRRVLLEYRIDVSDAVLPDPIKLPLPDQVRQFIDLADELELFNTPNDPPEGFAILMMVVGAIPFVAADGPGDDGAG